MRRIPNKKHMVLLSIVVYGAPTSKTRRRGALDVDVNEFVRCLAPLVIGISWIQSMVT
jgi:hypothetical protein